MSNSDLKKRVVMKTFGVENESGLKGCDFELVYNCLEFVKKSFTFRQKIEESADLKSKVGAQIYMDLKFFKDDYINKIKSLLGLKSEENLTHAFSLLIYLNSIEYYKHNKKEPNIEGLPPHRVIEVLETFIKELQKDQALAALWGNTDLVTHLMEKEVAIKLIVYQNSSLFTKAYNFFWATSPKHAHLIDLLTGVILSGEEKLFEKIATMYHRQIIELIQKSPMQMKSYLLSYAFRSEEVLMVKSLAERFGLNDEYISQSIGVSLVNQGFVSKKIIEDFYDIRPIKDSFSPRS